MERYRITTTHPAPATTPEVEQTWVLLPDRPSAEMQAEELARSRKGIRVRVYRESGPPAHPPERELLLDITR